MLVRVQRPAGNGAGREWEETTGISRGGKRRDPAAPRRERRRSEGGGKRGGSAWESEELRCERISAHSRASDDRENVVTKASLSTGRSRRREATWVWMVKPCDPASCKDSRTILPRNPAFTSQIAPRMLRLTGRGSLVMTSEREDGNHGGHKPGQACELCPLPQFPGNGCSRRDRCYAGRWRIATLNKVLALAQHSAGT